jgi:hypothetical protein
MNAPRHDPIIAELRRRRLLGMLCSGLVAVALWSIVGAIVALRLDDPEAARDFVWALIGSGTTLILVGLYDGRDHG